MSKKMSKGERAQEKIKKAKDRTMEKAADKPNEAVMEMVVRNLSETQLRVAQVKERYAYHICSQSQPIGC